MAPQLAPWQKSYPWWHPWKIWPGSKRVKVPHPTSTYYWSLWRHRHTSTTWLQWMCHLMTTLLNIMRLL